MDGATLVVTEWRRVHPERDDRCTKEAAGAKSARQRAATFISDVLGFADDAGEIFGVAVDLLVFGGVFSSRILI